jgi:hypothetical protein
VQRLIHVLLVPFLTIFAFEVWWFQRTEFRWLYLVLAIVSVVVYLPLLAWLALWIGLRVRSQIKAVLGTMALVAGWLFVPVAVRAALTDMAGIGVPSWVEWALALNPAEQIAAIEGLTRAALSARTDVDPLPLVNFLGLLAINFLVYSLLWHVLRRKCLENADRLLGRLDAPETLPSPISVIAWE